MNTKKIVSTLLIGTMALGFGALSFAGMPAETYSNLAGITVEDAYAERTADQTFGELAKENGFLAEFTKEITSDKLEYLEGLVENGSLSQEKFDEIVELMDEDCTLDPSVSRNIMRDAGIAYGRDNNNSALRDGTRANQNSDNRRGTANRTNETAPKDGTGFGARNGQGNRGGK